MNNNIELSVIIVNFNTKDILADCIQSIFKNLRGITWELIIVDNASTDGSTGYIKSLKFKKKNLKAYLLKHNIGFGGANNYAIKKSSGEFVLLLNSDTIIENDVIQKVYKWLKTNKRYGVASANLFNRDKSVQGTGGFFPDLVRVFSWMIIQDIPFVDLLIKPFHPIKPRFFNVGVAFYKVDKDLDWVTGAFMMIRKEVFKKAGYFDPDFFMYTEEVELCMRIKKAGWGIRYLSYPGVVHLMGASSNKEQIVLREFEGLKKLYKKHYPKWQYPILRCLLKFGSLWRMAVFGIINGRKEGAIYAEAYKNI